MKKKKHEQVKKTDVKVDRRNASQIFVMKIFQ